MIEKILSTFHAANIILAQQYRNMRFTKYSDLMSMLLLAEKHNELLLKNHGERPTGAFPMQSHATHVPTMRFISKGSHRRSKLEKRSQTPLQRTIQRAYKRSAHNLHRELFFRSLHPHNQLFKIIVRVSSVGPRAILQRVVRLPLIL